MNFRYDLNDLIVFQKASSTAVELNVKAYIVGGFVRDLILNKENGLNGFRKNEIDFVVIGDGPNFASELAKKYGIDKINILKISELQTSRLMVLNWNLLVREKNHIKNPVGNRL